MTINIRGASYIAPGSVTSDKLADGAVTEAKLATDAVTTQKVKDNAITTAKAIAALATHIYVGDETEVSVTGVDWVEEKNFSVTKGNTPIMDWKKLHAQAIMKTNDVNYTASLGVFINNEATPRITITTTSDVYEIASGECDISDLGPGKHTIRIKMKSDNAAGISHNELLDVFTEL